MLFLVISSPRPEKPSAVRANQQQFWKWINPLIEQGRVKQVYTKLGRGAVTIFDVESHEALHGYVNAWSECVPATFEVHALLPKEHQERIAMSGKSPLAETAS